MSLLVRFAAQASPRRENEISALTPSSASVALMVTVYVKKNIFKRNHCFKPYYLRSFSQYVKVGTLLNQTIPTPHRFVLSSGGRDVHDLQRFNLLP